MIILSGPDHWDTWIGVIRTKANAAAIWPYIDSATDENDNRPVLQKPQLPTAADITAERSPLTATGSTPAYFFHRTCCPSCYHGEYITIDLG